MLKLGAETEIYQVKLGDYQVYQHSGGKIELYGSEMSNHAKIVSTYLFTWYH